MDIYLDICLASPLKSHFDILLAFQKACELACVKDCKTACESAFRTSQKEAEH